ncbi:MAG: site-specific DNA-methyltransferase [Alphaproteobacteria bacterium]|nr:site-specific DNA-methyltransferase [Alphaproteobacteria bacterium]
MKKDTILCGDCIEKMRSFAPHSVDMIFADPPYFMQTSGCLNRGDGTRFQGVDESWDKFSDLHDYDDFCRLWLTECRRILKPTGTIWVIGSMQNIYRLGYLMQEMGFWILNEVIWTKPNAPPNFTGTRFQNRHETLLWCSPKKASPYTFNYQTLKALNGGKQATSVWDIPICLGPERLKGPDGKKLHATQKPEKLMYQIILTSTKPGDLILDPFMGTGTTGAVAKMLGRHFIGIEREEKYVQSARQRIKSVRVRMDDFANLVLDKKPPKVMFSHLLKKGILKEGDYLYTPTHKKARILKNGHLKSGRLTGSIHQLAAKLQNKNASNGWLFWHILTKNGYQPIDILRRKN